MPGRPFIASAAAVAIGVTAAVIVARDERQPAVPGRADAARFEVVAVARDVAARGRSAADPVRRVRQQLASLAERVRALEAAVVGVGRRGSSMEGGVQLRGGESAMIPATPPVPPSDAAGRSRDRKAWQERFIREAPDPEWDIELGAAWSAMRSTLADTRFRTLEIDELLCKETLCQVRYSHDGLPEPLVSHLLGSVAPGVAVAEVAQTDASGGVAILSRPGAEAAP